MSRFGFAIPCAIPWALALLASGCTSGLIYTHTVQPLTTNFDRTPVMEDSDGRNGDIKNIRYYVEAYWDSNAIGDIARSEGIETVYYADLEILSVLGIWRQYTVHIYGKKAEVTN